MPAAFVGAADKGDALRLAQPQALGQLPTVAVPDVATRQWRALIAHRQALVGRRCAAQDRIRAALVGQGLPALRGEGLERAGPGGDRPARQAPGRLRRRRAVARPAGAGPGRVPVI
jgi:hypothetical protein